MSQTNIKQKILVLFNENKCVKSENMKTLRTRLPPQNEWTCTQDMSTNELCNSRDTYNAKK